MRRVWVHLAAFLALTGPAWAQSCTTYTPSGYPWKTNSCLFYYDLNAAIASRMPLTGGTLTGTLIANGGLAFGTTPITSASSPYTVLPTDYAIACNATAGAVTVDLPIATGSGRILKVIKTDSSANGCTLSAGAGTILAVGSTDLISVQGGYVKIQDIAAGQWGLGG